MRHASSDMLHFNLMSPEDISDFFFFFLSHHCNNLKFENLGESQLKTWSPGLTCASCKNLCVLGSYEICALYSEN
jgi:hypothetical protein